MQRCPGWAAPLAALHQALTQESSLLPSWECRYPHHIISKLVVEGERGAGQGITALSCLGVRTTHQSALAFIGENLVT